MRPARPPAAAITALALLLALAGAGALGPHASGDLPPGEWTSGATPAALPIDAGTSLLVVSPHPDDESLCCAGAIQRAIRLGARVSIVWVTSGDGSRIDTLLLQRSLLASPRRFLTLGRQRMQEARAAATSLGVPAWGQMFLGYPDGGLGALAAGRSKTAYRSQTSGARQVPYPTALFPGHPYTQESLEKDFGAVLDRVRPTLILAPSIEDSHPDHRAAGLLTMRVLLQRGSLASVRYWIIHGQPGWPAPRGLCQDLPLTVPPHGPALQDFQLLLEGAEEAGKLRAVKAHQTQMQVMAPFLLAFVRTNEVYFRGATAVSRPGPPPQGMLKTP